MSRSVRWGAGITSWTGERKKFTWSGYAREQQNKRNAEQRHETKLIRTGNHEIVEDAYLAREHPDTLEALLADLYGREVARTHRGRCGCEICERQYA